MIKSGTTCCIDFERKGDLAVKAYEASGMRAVLARVFSDRAPDFYTEKQKEADLSIEKTGEIRKDIERLIETYHNKCNGRIRVMPAPNLIYKCTEEILEESRDLANKYETGLTVHLNETKAEVQYSVTKHGVQEIEYAHSLGLLGSDTIVAHGVWATEKEMDILAKTKSTCAHCPESNMYLASGIAPIPEMMERGINVSLATDGPASNNNLDMFEAMRFAALLHKVSHLNPAAISSIDSLKMATINGARALNITKRIGSLEKGKAADVVLVDMKRVNTTPVYNPVSNLVYCSTGDNVDTVIINGKILLRDRKFTCLDENEILERVQKIADRVKKILIQNTEFEKDPSHANPAKKKH
jgi:5-methylthioadenosine/S-adenosylhomocysteine deaminase